MGLQRLFIAFEGIDGSGKTFAAGHLADYLFRKTHTDVLLTREPSHGGIGKKIRQLLAKDHDPYFGAEKYLALYVADRKDHLKKTILPALKTGKFVVCDRYFISTAAFQEAQGVGLEKIEKMHEKMPVPDLTILLDATPEKALARMSGRERTEKFEKLGFLKAVRKNYLRLAKKMPEGKVTIIDADQPLEKMLQDVEKTLDAFLAAENRQKPKPF